MSVEGTVLTAVEHSGFAKEPEAVSAQTALKSSWCICMLTPVRQSPFLLGSLSMKLLLLVYVPSLHKTEVLPFSISA